MAFRSINLLLITYGKPNISTNNKEIFHPTKLYFITFSFSFRYLTFFLFYVCCGWKNVKKRPDTKIRRSKNTGWVVFFLHSEFSLNDSYHWHTRNANFSPAKFHICRRQYFRRCKLKVESTYVRIFFSFILLVCLLIRVK